MQLLSIARFIYSGVSYYSFAITTIIYFVFLIIAIKKLILKELLNFYYYFKASETATATATVAPTIGLLPIPINPIISTCAGTDDEPAN